MDRTKPVDRNGTLSVIFAASMVFLLGPVGAVLAIVFAVRSRRELGYRSTKAWIGLIAGSLVVTLFVLVVLLIVWFDQFVADLLAADDGVGPRPALESIQYYAVFVRTETRRISGPAARPAVLRAARLHGQDEPADPQRAPAAGLARHACVDGPVRACEPRGTSPQRRPGAPSPEQPRRARSGPQGRGRQLSRRTPAGSAARADGTRRRRPAAGSAARRTTRARVVVDRRDAPSAATARRPVAGVRPGPTEAVSAQLVSASCDVGLRGRVGPCRQAQSIEVGIQRVHDRPRAAAVGADRLEHPGPESGRSAWAKAIVFPSGDQAGTPS